MTDQEMLLGSWQVEATTPNQGTFPALLTFITDGSVIGDESPNPFESSAHGNWRATDGGEIAYTFVALFGSAEGKNTGRAKVVGRLALDRDTGMWDGPFQIDVYDAKGQTSFSDRGVFRLSRIPVESLDG